MIYRVEHRIDKRDVEQLVERYPSQEELEDSFKREMIIELLRDKNFLDTFNLERIDEGRTTLYRILINI